MILLITINILLMIWIYMKYIYIPKIYEINSESIEELDPALIGYIYDQNGNSIDWILAEILELYRKEYIDMEYVRKDIDEYEYIMRKKDNIEISQLKKYELTAYRFLFSESNEISMSELEEKVLRSMQAETDVHVKSVSIKNEIEEELIKQNIIDNTAKKILNILKKGYMILILIIIYLMKNIQSSYGIIIFIESIIIFYMFSKSRAFTKQGKKLYSNIKQYKKNLEYNEILKEKKIMHNILLEKVYANSIALHIMSEARREFIHDEILEKNVKNAVGDISKVLYIMIYVILYGAIFYIIK